MNETKTEVKIKFTPGPLTIHGPSPGGTGMDDGGDYAICDADRKIIAEVIYKVGKDDFRPAKANAELYALAPEMAEMLRDARDALVWATGSGDFGPGGQAYNGAKKIIYPPMDQIKALLAKLDGE